MKGILPPARLRFRGMIATGGIGSGSFFLASGNETLGREESRAGRFLRRRDYCKLHIVSHYVKALLGDGMAVYPVGRVGDDPVASTLLREMEEAGLDTRFVKPIAGVSTLFSFCILYPDGSGGNLTTEDSASSCLGPRDIEEAAAVIPALGTEGIAVALPEVPLEARAALLDLATAHRLFRAASFTRAEMEEGETQRLTDKVDLLAINAEEAAALAGGGTGVEEVISRISKAHPRLSLSVTAGRSGSWSWDARELRHHPALRVEARGTAGAGDAHLAGTLSGLALGLSLAEAHSLGTLLAGASVLSPDTINREIDLDLLRGLCESNPGIAPRVVAMLDTPMRGP